MLKQYRLKNYHFQLVVYIIALSIIGILLIGSAKHSVQSKQIIHSSDDMRGAAV